MDTRDRVYRFLGEIEREVEQKLREKKILNIAGSDTVSLIVTGHVYSLRSDDWLEYDRFLRSSIYGKNSEKPQTFSHGTLATLVLNYLYQKSVTCDMGHVHFGREFIVDVPLKIQDDKRMNLCEFHALPYKHSWVEKGQNN